jgi:hypothetical protein
MCTLCDIEVLGDMPESLCDEHEWTGYGVCPKCVEQYPDEVAAMHRRLGTGGTDRGT